MPVNKWSRHYRHWQVVDKITNKFSTSESVRVHRADWNDIVVLLTGLRKLRNIYANKSRRRRQRKKLQAASV